MAFSIVFCSCGNSARRVWAGLAVLLLSGPFAHSSETDQKSESSEALVSRLVSESQKHAIVRKVDPSDVLFQAESFAVGLASDVSLFNEWMLKIIHAYASRGDQENTVYLAGRLPGAGVAQANADIAVIQAKFGKKAEAEQHLNSALKQAGQLLGLQAEHVRAQCALALHLMGRADEAGSLEKDLGNLELLSHDTRLQEENLRSPLTLLDAKRRLLSVTEQGSDERKARFLLACAKQQFKKGSVSLANPFLEEIGSMAMEAGLPNAQRVLLDLAQVAWAGGQEKTARKSLNLFLKCCEAYSDNVQWKAPYLADACGVMTDWKEEDNAAHWLKAAEACIPQVFVLDAPEALIAIAKQRERLDGAVAAEPLLLAAIKAGAANRHPRTFAETAVRICLFYAESGKPVSEKVAKMLNSADQEVNFSK